MSDTLITVIAIGLAAILMFVFPLMTISDRTDDVSQLAVKTATTEFVDTARTTGKITEANYDKFLETITSTGNTYDVELEVEVRDTNLGKKTSMVQADKIGENASYTVYTSQIMNEWDKQKKAGKTEAIYYCKEGDLISARVKNTNQTISQQLKNFFYTVTGNDTYTIAANHAGIVTANGR